MVSMNATPGSALPCAAVGSDKLVARRGGTATLADVLRAGAPCRACSSRAEHDTAADVVDAGRHRSGGDKERFIAILSHELRNPLQAVCSAVAGLARQRLAAPDAAAVRLIERQLDHLTDLVECLFDASCIGQQKIRLRAEPVLVATAIEAAVEGNRPLLEANRLQLRLRVPDAGGWVLGDRVRLTQVFGNLLHNAAKFSAPGGVIEVEVRAAEGGGDHGRVVVSVRDQGSGIAAGLVDSLFELYTQSGRDHRGLGVGLWVVRNLVELHGGKVSVRSDGVDKGTEFVVELPSTQVPCPAVAAMAALAQGRRRSVLVVDDDRDSAESMQALLRMEGHTVALAFTGESALAQAALLHPQVVILDRGLPDISGDEVARRMRATLRACAPMVVALTGSDHGCAPNRVFDHHFVKPADLGALLAVLAA